MDGNDYIDYAMGFGPTILGHSPTPVIEAVRQQLALGIDYGACHPLEAELAEAVCRTVPCAESCVFSTTGSEAVHAALRIARSATGRNRIIKFLGHFHGWFDPLSIGLPGAAEASPGTGGQDPLASESVTVIPWNDIEALDAVLTEEVAAVIMEPVAVNGGCIRADAGYLEAVRELTRRTGTVLIFDEVITGYRLALGGAQERLGVVPDLAVLGKALGAGFPISAVVGRAEIMEEVVSQRVRHAGTFNTNPVSTSAALAAVTTLEAQADEIYPHLDAMGTGLARILREETAAAGIPIVVNQLGAAAHAFWSTESISTLGATLDADQDAYGRFAATLLDEGVHVIPRGLLYVSTEHTHDQLEVTRQAVAKAATTVRRTQLVGP